MKQYECGKLVPGCGWKTAHAEEAEVVRRAAEHMRSAHQEQSVRPGMIEQIKARITDDGVPSAKAS